MPMNLHTPWTFLYDNQQKAKTTLENWKDAIKSIATVDCVESFLFVCEEIGDAIDWPYGSNQHFFRDNIEPAWEDPQNINGGKWVLELNRDSVEDQVLNDIWLKTKAFCISEIAQNMNICGCVFSPRKFVDRIALWTRTKGPEVVEIGNLWKLHAGFDQPIGYKIHENSLRGIRDRNMDIYKV